jgi:hypothetical protein
MEKWKSITIPGLELLPLGCPACRQSLYLLRYSVSSVWGFAFIISAIGADKWSVPCPDEFASGQKYPDSLQGWCGSRDGQEYLLPQPRMEAPFLGSLYSQSVPAGYTAIITFHCSSPVTLEALEALIFYGTIRPASKCLLQVGRWRARVPIRSFFFLSVFLIFQAALQALRFTQSLAEMRTVNLPGGKEGRRVRLAT